MTVIERWKEKARTLREEIRAIYLACKDSRTPWYAKALAMCVITYAFSPIDLIPDFIPILGYADELILLPLAIAGARRMIPPVVLAECRLKADKASIQRKGKNWMMAGVIIVIWILLAVLAMNWVKEYF